MPETPEMVEAVARAISGAPFSTASSRRKARAAIEAVRDYAYPQAELILADGNVPVVTLSGEAPAKILRALINLATTQAFALASPEEGREP